MQEQGRMTLGEYEAAYGRVCESVRRIPAPGVLRDVAKIFSPGGAHPLSNAQINREYLRFKARDGSEIGPHEAVYDESRIAGDHCKCGAGNGRFRLVPFHHASVQEGGKRYMRCDGCGGWSHL